MGARLGVVIAFVVAMAAGSAVAGTGGRMGGGSWSSHSSSSSSHSYSSHSYSSHSYSSPSSSSYSHSYSSGGHYYGSSGGGDIGVIMLVVVGVIVIVIIAAAIKAQSGGGGGGYTYYGGGESSPSGVDVGVLRIALDGRARKFVQNELARIAKVSDTATEEGRATMLREVTLLLRRVRDAWVYGGAVNEPMRDMGGAKACFDRHVDDARVRFTHETVANEQGKIATADAPDSIPRSEEGEGLILVSIIVAANTELFTVTRIDDGEQLRQALEAASFRRASDLVAIEIVWQPSEENDRMSSMELEAKYPKPDLIPIRGALVGKTFCSYCGGPFPAELVSCPHCGAPAPGHESTMPRAA